MKLFVFFVFLFFSGQSFAIPTCSAFWSARKQGSDWSYRPDLNDYNARCASMLVVAKSPQGQCGVLVPVKNEVEEQLEDSWKTRFDVWQDIHWFTCKQNEIEYSVGDVVQDAELKYSCRIIAQGARHGKQCTGILYFKK